MVSHKQTNEKSNMTNSNKIVNPAIQSENTILDAIQSEIHKRYPRNVQLLPYWDSLFRSKLIRCVDNKSECLFKNSHRSDGNNRGSYSMVGPKYFHKHVKRMAETTINYVTTDEDSAKNEIPQFLEAGNSIIELEIPSIELAKNESIENITFEIGTNDNITSENMTELEITEYVTAEADPRKTIYIHGLFELSGGCHDFPETADYEYKAAQLAIRHINERKRRRWLQTSNVS
ncbi:hypothetical protein CEXT_441951 [Caerostris extrusa]|uniref:Uncharacterized protein n=1 Tax=Caerostris extrusa TaxID=172846 RepID=A0AAV4WK17_CAEEX|nr:hypothetical protein CEXT_441951 [Caerostris extrusa]